MKINIKKIDANKISELKKELTDFPLSDEIISILISRGFDSARKIKKFLVPKIGDLTNPFTINDMEKAVLRVQKAIKNKEKILIYGDSDVDGQTSISLLKMFLREFGCEADYYIPVQEGYGLHKSILPKLLEDKIDLLITVDCGITNVEEIKYLTENNIEIIVTDHHEPLEVIPEAYAVVNPKINNLKIKDLAGCGVVFYFCWAFLMYSAEYFERISELDWQKLLKTDYAIISFFKRYISFATLGTISDIMPLLDDNRFIVKTGLHNLRHSKIKAIDAWLEKLKCETDKLNATFVAWNVTPILNSAGRMEKPELGVSFLCAETSLEAMQILSEIEKLNNSRRKIQTRDVKTVEKMLRDDENIVFVAHQSLDKNVTGIVANNVMKKYEKPVFVIAKGETQSVGSVRAPKGYDMVSWFELCSDSLERFGGHKLAGGFTINNENILDFRDQLLKISETKNVLKDDFYEVDLEVQSKGLTGHFLKEIFMLEPFGHGNQSPVLLIKDCEFVNIDFLGADKSHLKGKIKIGDGLLEVIGWSMADKLEYIKNKNIIDIVGSVDKNYYNGETILRINLQEIL